MKSLLGKFQHLPELKPGVTIATSSSGEYSMHELLEHLLGITGPALVRVSSFSISEVAIRAFYSLTASGTITRLDCLFDISVKRHKLGLMFFASNIGCRIALSKNHAKILLIENDRWKLVVVGSANLQLNDKNEVAVISTDPGFYDYYSQTFQLWFSKALTISPDEFN
jgi:hypothetical protein